MRQALLVAFLLISLHGNGVLGADCHHINETIERDIDCKVLWKHVKDVSTGVGSSDLMPILNACAEDRECYNNINSYITHCVSQVWLHKLASSH